MEERQDIERVQKVALQVILVNGFENYRNALKTAYLETRSDVLNNKIKAEKNVKHKN